MDMTTANQSPAPERLYSRSPTKCLMSPSLIDVGSRRDLQGEMRHDPPTVSHNGDPCRYYG